MKITIPLHIYEQLFEALKNAGNHETGGILMGEHVSVDEFRVKEITVQPQLGSFSSFIRTLSHALGSLNKFFQKTRYDYARFNYMGEWHSHPSFTPVPSIKDISTMVDSVNDKKIGASFLILIILKLSSIGSIEGSATVFYPNLPFTRCELIFSET